MRPGGAGPYRPAKLAVVRRFWLDLVREIRCGISVHYDEFARPLGPLIDAFAGAKSSARLTGPGVEPLDRPATLIADIDVIRNCVQPGYVRLTDSSSLNVSTVATTKTKQERCNPCIDLNVRCKGKWHCSGHFSFCSQG
jgi:hypothetical protein